jgi:hypothetical protein
MRNIMFQSSWADYEESHSVVIWEQNGNYFVRTQGHNVMTGDFDEKHQVTSEEALEIMMEEEAFEDTEYLETGRF